MDRIRTATIVAQHTELKPGMHISLVLYNGNNTMLAHEIYDYLGDCMHHDTPIPLDGTEFRLRIEDVEIQNSPDFLNHSTNYKINLKGELI